jgi:hypothetical protein
MPENLIGSVRVTPANARPGESVLVEVLAPDGRPVDPSLNVMVNGIRGARRYIQYSGPGTFDVSALASAGSHSESTNAAVVVAATSWPTVAAPEGAASIEVPQQIRRLPLLSAAPVLETRAPYHLQFAASDTAEFTANMARHYQQDGMLAQQLDAALAIRAYHWDFGDGTSAGTANGFIDHDFSAALAVDQEHRLFDVTCTIDTAGAGTFAVKRTLSVVNSYAVCRNRGVVAPPVIYETHARKVLTAFEVSISVRNLEAVALSLTRQRILYERGDSEVMGAVQVLETPFVLRPLASTMLTIAIPFAQVPADATGIGLVFLGKDGAGRAIHVETHVDVALPDHRTGGLLLRGMALTKVAATGIAKLLVNPPGIQTSGSPSLSENLLVQERGVALSRRPALSRTGSPRPTFQSDGTVFSQVSSTFQPVAGVSQTVRQLTDNEGVRNVIFNGVELSPDIRNTLHLDSNDATRLRVLSDFAKENRLRLPAASEGADCDPDNLPDTGDDSWTCQIKQVNGKDEMVNWHRHAGFLNARKGDLLLAPGGPAGFIGGLLRQVTPPQHYGHIGIMTRNHDMVTHSTFSEERLLDHSNGSISLPFGLADEPAPTDGFTPDVLRYGWPGVVTQWVKGAVGPEGRLADLAHMPAPGEPETEIPAIDPNGKTYPINPFNRYAEAYYSGAEWEIVPPLVVKPDPLEETLEIRARLHAVADAAIAATGKSHYRFFCYTDASIGLNTTVPSEADWPGGTFPSVCSSFIWVLLRRAGVQMEAPRPMATAADLEPKDVSAGAEVGDGAPDGLYLYRANEREVAAKWLHEKLKSKISDELKGRVKAAAEKAGIDLTDQLEGLAGGLIDTFSDIGDDVANQMVNAFASDDASTAAKDSDAWKRLSDSRAVSPDNTLFWDAPSNGGLYGYVVPASYIPARAEQAPHYVWKYVPTHGALQGVLTVAGEPKSRGMIQLNDGLTAFTDANGHYLLPKVPFGHYTAKAQWDQGDGIVVTGNQRLEMNQTQQTLNFELQRPAEMYRTLHITGDTYFMKYYTVGRNPRQSFPFDFSIDVAPEPGRNVARWTVRQDFHGIYGVAAFLFILEEEGTVRWNVAWAVSQDGNVVEDMANSLSAAVEDISLGFISGLFGNEVNGANSRSGEIGRSAPAVVDSMRIGPDDGTTGLLNFHIQNLGV